MARASLRLKAKHGRKGIARRLVDPLHDSRRLVGAFRQHALGRDIGVHPRLPRTESARVDA